MKGGKCNVIQEKMSSLIRCCDCVLFNKVLLYLSLLQVPRLQDLLVY